MSSNDNKGAAMRLTKDVLLEFERDTRTTARFKVEDFLERCRDVEADVTELLSIQSSLDNDSNK